MIARNVASLGVLGCVGGLLVTGCSRSVGDREEVGKEWDQRPPALPSRPVEVPRGGGGAGNPEPTRSAETEDYEALVRLGLAPAELRSRLGAFYRAWGRARGAEAVEHAMGENKALARHAFAGWLESDARAPRDWVLSMRTGSRRQAGLASELLNALPAGDDAARAGWAAQFAGFPTGAPLVTEVAIGWGRTDPAGVLGWLAGLPEGEARASALESVFQRWIREEPEEASSHLTRMPDGAAKDLAIGSLARAIRAEDPEAARLWAETISDDRLRERALEFLRKSAPSDRAALPDR